MGEVYSATDTRLDRTVAIKVLPAELASDRDRRDRFEREAKAIAALNHPHICTLYDVGHDDPSTGSGQAVDFLVMEHLEGESLQDRLKKGALPLDQALQIGIQIADALDKAHRQGITHRDLKPGNIFLTKSGAKLLDFGLAKLTETATAGEDSTKLADSLTAQGTILGTFHYMAPEQLEGKEADHRSDVWAFGCVVHEMVTGQKAFEGTSQASLISAIMKDEPRTMSALQPMSPAALDQVVRICLAKDPDERWQSVGDLGRNLSLTLGTAAAPDSATTTSSEPSWRHDWSRTASVALAASILVGFMSVLATWGFMRSQPGSDAREETSRSVRFAFEEVIKNPLGIGLRGVGLIAMSPEGTTVAYLGGRRSTTLDRSVPVGEQLYLRRIDQAEARMIPDTEGASNLFFSPDGAWVGFTHRGRLQRVPVAGGAPLEVTAVGNVFGASWSPDDRIIFGGGLSAGLFEVPVAGGEPQALTIPDADAGEIHHGFPEILPDGRTVLFTVATGEGSRIAKLSLDSGQWEQLLPAGGSARYVEPGYIVYSEDGNLRIVRFDAATGQVLGSAHPLIESVETGNQAGDVLPEDDDSRDLDNLPT